MQNTKSALMFTVAEMADALGVTDRQVRNWIKDKGLPAKKMPGVQRLDVRAVIAWYVDFRLSENGNFGNQPSKSGPGEPEETYDQALARRTRAEADLKELELANRSGEVAAISDIERVYSAAFKSIQTLILSMPTSLTPRLLGLTDRNQVHALLDQAVRDALTNLPGSAAEAIRTVTPAASAPEAE